MSTSNQGLKTHSVYNARNWMRNPETQEVIKGQDGSPILNPIDSVYENSIIIHQRVTNAEVAGQLPELLTANTVKKLSETYKDLKFLKDTDYPLHTDDNIAINVNHVTGSGVEVIEYRYKVPSAGKEEDFPTQQ